MSQKHTLDGHERHIPCGLLLPALGDPSGLGFGGNVRDGARIIVGGSDVTRQVALVSCQVESRRIGGVFQMGLILPPVSHVAGDDLPESLVAAGVAHGTHFMQNFVIEAGFGQTRLVRKKAIDELDEARFVLVQLLFSYKDFFAGEERGARVIPGERDQAQAHKFFLRFLPAKFAAERLQRAEDGHGQEHKRPNCVSGKLHLEAWSGSSMRLLCCEWREFFANRQK